MAAFFIGQLFNLVNPQCLKACQKYIYLIFYLALSDEKNTFTLVVNLSNSFPRVCIDVCVLLHTCIMSPGYGNQLPSKQVSADQMEDVLLIGRLAELREDQGADHWKV